MRADIGLRGLHAPSQLRLRQARGAGLYRRPREVELFTEVVVGCRVVGVLAPAAVELTDQRAIGAARLRCVKTRTGLGHNSVTLRLSLDFRP